MSRITRNNKREFIVQDFLCSVSAVVSEADGVQIWGNVPIQFSPSQLRKFAAWCIARAEEMEKK